MKRCRLGGFQALGMSSGSPLKRSTESTEKIERPQRNLASVNNEHFSHHGECP